MGRYKGLTVIAVLVFVCFSQNLYAEKEGEYEKRRLQMVERTIEDRGLKNPDVLHAMRTVRRHEFVPEMLKPVAYADRPLPIGYGQTISQPYIVAAMTELLDVKEGDVVLEVGTGSGYQAAVLGKIVGQVYTLEIIKELGESARSRLKRLNYQNVEARVGDGYYGWEEHAPFDSIVVTAAATHIPPPLIEQLKPGGKMMIPVGPVFHVQTLMLVEKQEDGSIIQRSVMPVRFVPLTGEH